MPTGIYTRTEKHLKQIHSITGSNKGIKFSKEWCKNLSKAHKGQTAWNKGIKRYWNSPTEFKKGDIRISGKNSNFWKGGISFEPYSVDWTETLKRSIRERDHYICQICNKSQENRAFDIHHIDYNKKNCDPNNLVTLCASCHTKTSNKRKYWIEFFDKYADKKD